MVRALIIGICLSGLIFVGVSASYPFNPAFDNTGQFDRRYHITSSVPFLSSSLLLTPRSYDPDETYPLVLALHGGYKRSVGAFVAAQDEFQEHHGAFVLMPMALLGQPWVTGQADGSGMEPSKSLRLAMDILTDVVEEYPVDPSRIYVTGSSNGAVGTFAALVHYPDTFAAGVPVNGWWFLEDAAALSATNLAIYHGVNDPMNSIGGIRGLVAAIRAAGGRPEFVEMANVGHDSRPAYAQLELWNWLFAQRRYR